MASKSKGTKKSNNKNKQTATTTSSSWSSYYILSTLPIPILIIASYLLRNTITSPPSDYGTGSMFDLIATRYDFINKALALNLDMSWRHRLVAEVVGPNGEIFDTTNNNDDKVQILDLATGTADVAILLGKAAAKYNNHNNPTSSSSSESNKADGDSFHHTSTTVLGLDPSQNMLNVGKTKVTNEELTNIVTLELGDARKLDTIQDDTFNAATMSFGIRNVPEKEVALCEIHRVLKKKNNNKKNGGIIESKLAIMEFSEPGPNTGILGSLARLFIRHIVPAMGALLSGHPKEYMHLQKSIKDFPSPSEFVTLMESIKCPIKGDDGVEIEIDTFGSFRVTEVLNLNFGSVQIYVARPILKKYVTE